jgi:hypothetical protein
MIQILSNNFFQNKATEQATIQWAINTLSTLNYKLTNQQFTIVKDTPFSYVAFFQTHLGKIWLKATPKLIGIEPQLIELLRRDFHARVPEVIAQNRELDAFLIKDAGVSLREILKQEFDVHVVCQAIGQFTQTQIDVSTNIDEFIRLGIPNWSLSTLPEFYLEFLSQQKSLLWADGLTIQEYNALINLSGPIMKLCHKLSKYSIKNTIVQPDFNDNNILIIKEVNKITLIDLGELAVSHPFFSLINMLYQLKKHHGLKESDANYQKIRESCFTCYQKFHSHEKLLKAFELAQSLWFVHGVLAYERLMQACGPQRILSYQPGKLASTLRDLLAVFKET